jgi:hypothetical protein
MINKFQFQFIYTHILFITRNFLYFDNIVIIIEAIEFFHNCI